MSTQQEDFGPLSEAVRDRILVLTNMILKDIVKREDVSETMGLTLRDARNASLHALIQVTCTVFLRTYSYPGRKGVLFDIFDQTYKQVLAGENGVLPEKAPQ